MYILFDHNYDQMIEHLLECSDENHRNLINKKLISDGINFSEEFIKYYESILLDDDVNKMLDLAFYFYNNNNCILVEKFNKRIIEIMKNFLDKKPNAYFDKVVKSNDTEEIFNLSLYFNSTGDNDAVNLCYEIINMIIKLKSQKELERLNKIIEEYEKTPRNVNDVLKEFYSQHIIDIDDMPQKIHDFINKLEDMRCDM